MFCSNCGTQLPDTARFCKVCGSQTEEAVVQPTPQPSNRSVTGSDSVQDIAKRVEEFFGVNRWNTSKDRSAMRRLETDFRTYLSNYLEGLLPQCTAIDQSQKEALLSHQDICLKVERTIVNAMLIVLFVNRKKIDKHDVYIMADRLGTNEIGQIMDGATMIAKAFKG